MPSCQGLSLVSVQFRFIPCIVFAGTAQPCPYNSCKYVAQINCLHNVWSLVDGHIRWSDRNHAWLCKVLAIRVVYASLPK